MSALDAYKNLAIAQILTPPAPAASGTSITLMAGQGAYLPAVPFNATIFPPNLFPNPVNAEIVRVTARATDVLTITRAQEASTARTVLAGDYLAASFTEKFVADLRDSSNQNAGLLPDARLSTNVPLKNASNVFTGASQELGTQIVLRQPGAPADQRVWVLLDSTDSSFYLFSQNDAGSLIAPVYPFKLQKAGHLTIFGDFYEKNRATPMGHWINVPYASGNFTSNAGTWTVDASDQATYQYMLIGKTLFLSFYLNVTSISGAPTELRIALPGGFTSSNLAILAQLTYFDGTAWGIAYVVTQGSVAYVALRKDPAGTVAWPATTNGSTFICSFSFPVL